MVSNASLAGYNKIAAGSGENVVTATIKAPGTANTNFHSIPVFNQGAFIGTSNRQVTDVMIASGGPVGLSVGYAVNGVSVIGTGTNFRKGVELVQADPIAPFSHGAVHSKLSDNELRWGDQTAGGADKHLIDGRWVNSSGVLVQPLGTGYAHKVIVSGSGDREAIIGRGVQQPYHYRESLTNTQKSLPVRNG